MKSIFSKLVVLFLLAALVPVGISYWFSIHQLRKASKHEVIQGNAEVARIAALNVENYFTNALNILKTLKEELSELHLTAEQYERLIHNVFLSHGYFQSIDLYDKTDTLIATSRVDAREIKDVPYQKIKKVLATQDEYLSPIYIAQQPPPIRPAIRVAFPVKRLGHTEFILTSEINLIYVWHLVNQIKIAEKGIVSLVNNKGQMVGSSDLALVFELSPFGQYSLIEKHFKDKNNKALLYYKNHKDEYLLVQAMLQGQLTGRILIEEPTSEAFYLANQLSIKLIFFAALIIVLMLLVGYLGVRWEILKHLSALTEAIQKIGEGDWNSKVDIKSRDEFALLGKTLNTMTSQLSSQAEKIKRQERLSLIGKIAGGLVHDLKHPIQNIRNWSKLLNTKYNEEKFRNDFSDVVNREFSNVDLFFKNLKDLTSEMSFEPINIEVKDLFKQIESRFEVEMKNHNISCETHIQPDALVIKADKFSITRVLSNLVSNAIQAIMDDGHLKLEATQSQDKIMIAVEDTGMGIPQEKIAGIFDDFSTTKRKGLGLGLALVKKIVEQHQGSIEVTSQVGQGTRFEITLPSY